VQAACTTMDPTVAHRLGCRLLTSARCVCRMQEAVQEAVQAFRSALCQRVLRTPPELRSSDDCETLAQLLRGFEVCHTPSVLILRASTVHQRLRRGSVGRW
jgi:hypothetical protein